MLLLFNVIFLGFILGIVLFIYQYKTKKKAHQKQLVLKDELHKKDLLEAEMEIQSDTMQHIGQEIHDSVGQKLTLASLYLKQLPLDDFTTQQASPIQSVTDIIDNSLEELRQISKSLTQSNLKDKDLISLIEQLCNRVENLSKCKVAFVYDQEITLRNHTTKTVIYRIVQEFIQNSIKHAKCSLIEVKLTRFNHKHSLRLQLSDNGIGFDLGQDTAKGIGLENFKNRAAMIGAELQLNSQHNKGTQLTLDIENYGL
ncbi:histidine kinase/DNA gyrase B/HSP90-like ATPase [Aquimarina brevivitae]|uniref:histidine kinase n=2 Tax=Aquimarina brevivitae TaxID=323412 RepID=A0A4Q7PHX9_9FLAO|nr:histidine kinase/DNA gyrase B/HSP90-like ATPase [Aquimarina brevivitae]